MKKFLAVMLLSLLIVTLLSACNDSQTREEDVISVENGYLVVNGVKTEYQVYTDPVISVIDGYIAVNGIKTEYEAEPACDHEWQTVTTEPSCSDGGYDIMTCSVCNKTVKTNQTEAKGHSFSSTYVTDDEYHWLACTVCGDSKDKATHNVAEDGICADCQRPLSSTPGIIYDISADGTYAEVIGYTGTAAFVKIADEYNGLPVQKIYMGAFERNYLITNVLIPDTVTFIGYRAFGACDNLESIVIGDSITIIEENAFSACNSLRSVVIGNGVTCISAATFSDCSNLESVSLGNSVTTIESYAFYGCPKLASVTLPDTAINIEADAFSGCNAALFTKYDSCKYLRRGNNPYAVLLSKTDAVLSDYTVHEDTEVIAYGAFNSCTRLTSIIIPDGVKAINERAFSYCPNLTTVVIPKTVTSIGSHAFDSCKSITDVYYGGGESDWEKIVIEMSNDCLTDAAIHYNHIPVQ
ncbi:MAG: leucine-rich repeat domain-containing protein [Clostridia bacterium]|nr:leucine-rich repeat domain-containing protein [Clostridia bacterium]